MSLSRKQEENNYWPSISDMFLVFFVLALALASTMIKAKQDGDKFIQDDVIELAGSLVQTINDHQSGDARRIEWPPHPKEYIIGVARCVRQSREWVQKHYRNGGQEHQEELNGLLERADKSPANEDEAWELISYDVQIMYLTLGLGPNEGMSESHTDKMLRDIILEVCRKLGVPSPEDQLAETRKTIKNLERTIDYLRGVIQSDTSKEELARLQKELRDLKAELQRLQDENKRLQSSVEYWRNLASNYSDQNSEKDIRIAELEGRLEVIENNSRVSTVVMSGTDVNFEKGKNGKRDNKTGRETCTINQQAFSGLVSQIQGNLKKVKGRLIIEIIGHTDPDGGDDVNALLGLERAKFFQGKLKDALSPEENARIIYRTYSAADTDRKGSDDETRRIEVIIRPEQQWTEESDAQ